MANNGDTVLLTGKGHEKSINYGKGEELWNENSVALDAIKKRLNK
jgi:UDP-N-acetylmuramyl tripeptide synthase